MVNICEHDLGKTRYSCSLPAPEHEALHQHHQQVGPGHELGGSVVYKSFYDTHLSTEAFAHPSE